MDVDRGGWVCGFREGGWVFAERIGWGVGLGVSEKRGGGGGGDKARIFKVKPLGLLGE